MSLKDLLEIPDLGAVCAGIQRFIGENMERLYRKGCILGISGGIDSALVAALAVRAVGRENVEGIFLPERDSAMRTRGDARLVASALGIRMRTIRLTPLLRRIGIYRLQPPAFPFPRGIRERWVLWKEERHARGSDTTFLRMLRGGDGDGELLKAIAYLNVKHRLRAVLLHYYAELANRLVLGTCNRTEKSIGFFVKYGDSASDIDPIGNLYKTQVIRLSEHLHVPQSIIRKAPSPDLAPGITDEGAIGLRYEDLDRILVGLDNGIDEESILKEVEVPRASIAYVRKLMELSEHMRRLPPVFPYRRRAAH
jgi:NAD+ synthase